MELNAATLEEALKKFDTNGDGGLSAEEMAGVLMRPGGGAPMSKQDAEKFVKKFDRDGDGKLSLAELSSALAQAALCARPAPRRTPLSSHLPPRPRRVE